MNEFDAVKKKIDLAATLEGTTNRVTKTLAALVFPNGLAVHESDKWHSESVKDLLPSWTITHVATGLRLGPDYVHEKEALGVAAEADKAGPFEWPGLTFGHPPEDREVLRALEEALNAGYNLIRPEFWQDSNVS